MFRSTLRKLFGSSKKSRRRPIQTNRVSLRCESLEDRWVPATTNQVGSTLFVEFDTPGEIVNVRQLSDDHYLVHIDPLDLIGNHTGVNNIVVNGNGVDDITLHLDGNGDDSDALAGDFTVNQNSGNSLTIEDSATGGFMGGEGFGVQGNFTVNNNTSDSLWIQLSDGDHAFGNTIVNDNIADATILFGSANSGIDFSGYVSLNLGDGENAGMVVSSLITDFYSVVGGSSVDVASLIDTEVLTSVGVDLGGDANRVIIAGSTVNENVFGFQGAYSEITITASWIGGYVSFINNSNIDLDATIQSHPSLGATEILGFTSFVSGDGNDTVKLSTAPGDNAGENVHLHDNVGVNLGDGENIFQFDGTAMNDVVVDGNVFAYAASGLAPDGHTPIPDYASSGALSFLTLTRADINGFVSVINNSEFGLFVFAQQSHITDFFSAISDSGNDVIVTMTTEIGDNVAYDLAAGSDFISQENVQIGGLLSIVTGAGDDTIWLESDGGSTDSTYLGEIMIDMGADNDTLSFGLDFNDRALLHADANVDGGSGINLLNENGVAFFNGAVINDVNFN